MTEEQQRQIISVLETNVILPASFQGDRIDAARGAIRSAVAILNQLGCLKPIDNKQDAGISNVEEF